MKILWHMPTLRRTGCGLSIRAVQLAKRLQAFGHTITFAVCRPKTDITDGRIEGMPVRLLDIIGRPAAHWCFQAKTRSAAAGLVVRMLDADHDLMISCQPEVVSAYAATRNRRPLLYVCGGTTLLHDCADQARQRSVSIPRRWPGAIDRHLKHRNEKRGFTAADAVVFDSRHTCALVAAAYGLDTTRCHPIHGGLDEDHFRPPDVHQRRAARDRLGISPEDIVVAWTGRFSPEKNLELLLRALPDCQSLPDRVLLVGDGPMRPALVELTGRLGLEGIVQFPGRQSDVRPFLQAADIFAFPSHGESFGGALVEAMGCALACVALRPNGGEVRNANCEIIDQGQSGLLVDRPHPRAFAAALDLLARDASLRQRLGEAAHHRANRLFTWSAGARQLNALISELVRQHLRSDIHPGGIETSTPVAAETVR